MSDFNPYLTQLQKSLKNFSHAEREDILAEIQSHIEDGLQDPRMGRSKEERIKRMKTELGSPREMAGELRKNPYKHWAIDVLLALLPALMIFLGQIALWAFFTDDMFGSNLHYYTDYLILLIYYGLVYVGLRRHSPMLTVWWLSLTLLHSGKIALLGWATTPVWLLIGSVPFVLSLGLLVYKLWQQRDAFLIALVILVIFAITSAVLLPAADYRLITQVIFYISLVVFLFFPAQRHLRWLSLLALTIIYLVIQTFILQPLPTSYLTFYWTLLLGPIAVSLTSEYLLTRRNPLLSA